jgi:hypothetical protein
MQLNQMSPEEAAKQIVSSEKIHRHGINTDEEHIERVNMVTERTAAIIKFARNAKITSTEVRANRGRKPDCKESEKYPGVYVHQIITISDGFHKFEICHPDYVMARDYGDPTKVSLGSRLFKLWSMKEVDPSFMLKARILKAAPQLMDLFHELEGIRRDLTRDTVENAAEEYVNKTQGKAKAGIIKKMGSFLAECNLKDEDPEFLLQIMKFISRDNFWEMKNFFNYCRRNVGDINFLTPEEIIQAQNLAKAIEVQKS